MDAIHLATIKSGRIVFNDEERFSVDKSKLEGQDVEVIIRKKRKQRSNQQNRYYWGVVLKLLSEYTGYSVDECHEVVKQRFFPNIVEIAGIEYVVSTTTKSTTVEFEEKMSEIRTWVSCSIGGYVPEPNEVSL